MDAPIPRGEITTSRTSPVEHLSEDGGDLTRRFRRHRAEFANQTDQRHGAGLIERNVSGLALKREVDPKWRGLKRGGHRRHHHRKELIVQLVRLDH